MPGSYHPVAIDRSSPTISLTPSPAFIPQTVVGVDFSGGKLAGRNIWLAYCRPDRGLLSLDRLDSLETLCGSAERAPALAHLVEQIRGSSAALWGMDFPFGLPIEVLDAGADWLGQLRWLAEWKTEAYALGLECVRRAKLLGDSMHLRRETDVLARTPFDCYHYRIIYQTFHGMRDVLLPLLVDRQVAVLPFQYGQLKRARAVVVESCPSSTLKRLGLPHQNYKQPAGGPLTPVRRRTRHAILAGLADYVELPPAAVRKIMRNGGGDALDAVIAAVGSWHAWQTADHAAIRKHPRYVREGFLYF